MKKKLFTILLAVVAAVCLSLGLVACGDNVNGIYYKLKVSGEIDNDTYFKIEGGKWTDENGDNGSISRDGNNFVFYYEFMGEKEKVAEGTIENGVLTVKDPMGGIETYISDKHKHEYIGGARASAGLRIVDGEIITIGTCEDKDIVIPREHNGMPVASIANFAFVYCDSLESVTISDSVTSIGIGAFVYCSSLKNISIPDSMASIGNIAFSGCSSLEYNVYDGVKYLGNTNNPYVALIETRSYLITSCDINAQTKVIASYAFRGCGWLENMFLPDSVTNINAHAFDGCNALTNVYYSGTKADWEKVVIDSGNGSLTSAAIYYYSEINPYEINEKDSDKYWHYENGVRTVWTKEEIESNAA